jgi:hypothetical protein
MEILDVHACDAQASVVILVYSKPREATILSGIKNLDFERYCYHPDMTVSTASIFCPSIFSAMKI